MGKGTGIALLILTGATLISGLGSALQQLAKQASGKEPLRIGWIGPLTGPASAYGSWKAARLAVQEINSKGGVAGRPVELVPEDGRCEGLHAASAAQKLIQLKHLQFILGGHCAAESKAIAPIAERARVIQLAATTSVPRLAATRRYVFRITSIGWKVAEKLAPLARLNLKAGKLAVLHEMTEYAGPVAERFAELFIKAGGEVAAFEAFNPGTTDFRSALIRIRASQAEAIYLGVQTPDTALLVYRQMDDLGLMIPVLANEVAGHAALTGEMPDSFDGPIIFAEPKTDPQSAPAEEFLQRYEQAYNETPPLGLLTAESYDTVHLLIDVIRRCGEDIEQVRRCLLETKGRIGASGTFSIDEQGDGVREYRALRVLAGRAVDP